jgi:uncharacterized protein YoxC
VSGGDWALVILAVFWAVLVVFLSAMLVTMVRMLESIKLLIDGVRTETVPLLGEVKTTVSGVNRELDRVDSIMASAGNIAKSVERVSSVVEKTVSNPLIKLAALGAGAAKAAKRFRGEK